MSDIAIIGNSEMVDALGLLGIKVYDAKNVEQAKDLLNQVVEEKKVKLLFIVESLASHMKEELRGVMDYEWLIVSPLPDHTSEVSFLDDELKRLSREAIGMEI